MKKIVFFILVITLFTISCGKDEVSDPGYAGVTTDALKCASKGSENHFNNLKWRHMLEIVRNMNWIGQSCFSIEGQRFKIYTDPLSITQTDLADIILITHAHGDHFSQNDINKLAGPNTVVIAPADCNYSGPGKRVVLLPWQEYIVKGIKIKAVPAYNITKTQFHPKSNNWVGYLITVNGVTIYDAGDTERIPEMQAFTCDIALLPLGQVYTMNSVEDAAASAQDVKAKIAIPMHFGLYEGTGADAQTFKDLLEGKILVVIKTQGQ